MINKLLQLKPLQIGIYGYLLGFVISMLRSSRLDEAAAGYLLHPIAWLHYLPLVMLYFHNPDSANSPKVLKTVVLFGSLITILDIAFFIKSPISPVLWVKIPTFALVTYKSYLMLRDIPR